LVERYQGKVPDTMEELVQLPGVGRKTANVVLGGAFGKTEGIVVDTHIGRLSQRMGFTKNEDPVKIEADLMGIIPKKDWILIGNLLIRHGRTTCQARKPYCAGCRVQHMCPSADVFLSLAPSAGTKSRK
jgi:endonuclease-3